MHNNRSNRVTRRGAATILAVIAVGAGAPAGAVAQQIGPTDEEYDNGVLGVSASGDDGGAEIGELPFTGLDVAAIAAIGAGLVGAGFIVRRAARTEEEPTI